ncbi:MAG: AsnC family transcriptional regulator [Bacteroidetes bacterium QS_8_64_10]|nr:MAG: AsnC family transcriptional regulator [Bacteroidetes bacterium QS_8_64_10]
MAKQIDDVDARILELLQADGRMKRNAIAEDVGMSVPAVSERIRKLEERGVIRGYTAEVDVRRLRYDITAFVRANVDGSEHYANFVEQITAMSAVLEMHSITGEGSHMLKMRIPNTDSLERILSEIQKIEGVSRTRSSIVLSTFKETRAVPVEPMELYDYESTN